MNKNTQIIILAAGKGKRMESDDPKALAMLQGKPFLKHILDTVSTLKLPIPPVIVVGHKKERVQEVFGDTHHYAVQHEQLGTGHAVQSAKEALHKEHDTILVMCVDQPTVSKESLERILQTHQEKKSTITMGIVSVPDFNEWRAGMNHFGRVIRGADGRVKRIVEYKDTTDDEKEIREVNPALYAFNSEWLWENIDLLKNENAQGEFYLTDLIKIACEQGKNIEAIPVANSIEGIQPNSKAELEILENLLEN
jgi:bifunctional UDP-N-acetylglucosamine pyrophosphorylase/glucosamine-1-phosphate N-acetyltransferase